jgi:hypothetical protein
VNELHCSIAQPCVYCLLPSVALPIATLGHSGRSSSAAGIAGLWTCDFPKLMEGRRAGQELRQMPLPRARALLAASASLTVNERHKAFTRMRSQSLLALAVVGRSSSALVVPRRAVLQKCT